jgi:hypothetical protein
MMCYKGHGRKWSLLICGTVSALAWKIWTKIAENVRTTYLRAWITTFQQHNNCVLLLHVHQDVCLIKKELRLMLMTPARVIKFKGKGWVKTTHDFEPTRSLHCYHHPDTTTTARCGTYYILAVNSEVRLAAGNFMAATVRISKHQPHSFIKPGVQHCLW